MKKFVLLILAIVVMTAILSWSNKARAEDDKNCTSAKDGFGGVSVVCNDGTVTVSNGGHYTVCSKMVNGSMSCQKID